MRIQVIHADPRVHRTVWLEMQRDATVADALAACAFDRAGIAGMAIFGERVQDTHLLRDGDRLELLRPLQADPKEARRRRARRAGN